MSLLKLLQWVCWHSSSQVFHHPSGCWEELLIYVDYLNTTSFSGHWHIFTQLLFFFFQKEKKRRRSWPPYQWLNNPVQSHPHLCRDWLVSSAGGRLSWWWTSSGEITRLAECVRPGLVSEWHAKLDYWLLSRKRHKCLLKYSLYECGGGVEVCALVYALCVMHGWAIRVIPLLSI